MAPPISAQVPDANPFGTSQGVTPAEGVPNDELHTHASPEDFGGQVGAAVSKLGDTGVDIGQQFARMATEAKVNDDYANKYAPAAASLRAQYDSLQGQDKVAGYGTYVSSLQDLGRSFGENAPNPYYQQNMGQLISRHIFAETDGASRELVESQKKFAANSQFDMMQANNALAARNYNNPDVVNDLAARNDAHVVMQHMDVGHDPNDPQSQALIQGAQDNARGSMATAMINQAVESGDIASAMRIRADNTPVIPGYQRLAMDNTLHTAAMQQTGVAGVDALTTGKPLPETVGAPPSVVQASVANAAQASGVDANAALTVLRIESSNGQNLGTRGTIGQDKDSAGKSLDEQAKALCDNLKTANQQASTALGRKTEGWEDYAVYQQGAGGGVALIKALQDNPNAKAMDILKPLYDNPKDALTAVVKNGGNAGMTVSDFTDHIKQLYNDNFKRANCDFGQNQQTPGDQILAPHQQEGVTVQPAASPIQDLRNFDRTSQTTLSQIQAIPNYETRQRLLDAYKEKRSVYAEKANAYSNDLVNQATQLAVKPDFTSMSQVPPEMAASLATDHPQTLAYMEARAEHNLANAGGTVTKDMKEYGSGYKGVLQDIWDGKITSSTQLHDAVAKDQLTISGYDLMTKQLPTAKEDPIQKQNENAANKKSFGIVENQITHGMRPEVLAASPDIQKTVASVDAVLFNAIDERKSRNIPSSQYYDPTNKEWIGNDAKVFQITHADSVAATIKANQSATHPTTLADIIGQAKATNDPAKQAALRQQAIDLGLYDPNAPTVPVAQ